MQITVNRWELELATYNLTLKWISRGHNKAADCLSCLVELPHDRPTTINMLSATNSDGPTFNIGVGLLSIAHLKISPKGRCCSTRCH